MLEKYSLIDNNTPETNTSEVNIEALEADTTEIVSANNLATLDEVNENLDTLVNLGYIGVWFIFIIIVYYVFRFLYNGIIMKIINKYLNIRI